MKKSIITFYLILLVFVALFIVIDYCITPYIQNIRNRLVTNYLIGIIVYLIGIIVYLILAIIDAGGIPITIVPLIPIVSGLYGVIISSILTTIGWTVGTIGGFFIARIYGIKIVKKLFSQKRIDEVKILIPRKNLFLVVFLLRLLMPLDLVTYVIGILTEIRFRPFILASIPGIVISAVYLSYLGSLPLIYEVIGFLVGIVLLIIIHIFLSNKAKKERLT
jgi:uncharacterized membrane protein YdjX (TVP38/TMEM64 family)